MAYPYHSFATICDFAANCLNYWKLNGSNTRLYAVGNLSIDALTFLGHGVRTPSPSSRWRSRLQTSAHHNTRWRPRKSPTWRRRRSSSIFCVYCVGRRHRTFWICALWSQSSFPAFLETAEYIFRTAQIDDMMATQHILRMKLVERKLDEWNACC